MKTAQETLAELSALDNSERLAYRYYSEYGEEIDEMLLLKAVRCGLSDFEEVKKADPDDEMLKILSDTESGGFLKENLFMPEGRSIELNNVQRYTSLQAHKHDFFETVVVLMGVCTHVIENQTVKMRAGDVIVVPPYVRHYTSGSRDSVAVNIKIRQSAFKQALSPIVHRNDEIGNYFSHIVYSDKYRNFLRTHCEADELFMNVVLWMYSMQKDNGGAVNSILESLLTAFFAYVSANGRDTFVSSAFNDKNDITTLIESYVYANYKTLSLNALAKHFYMSTSYMSRLVKNQTGKTFAKLLKDIKMSAAEKLIRTTFLSVESVCEEVGYKDVTQFIRTFREYYNTTPKKYRISLAE